MVRKDLRPLYHTAVNKCFRDTIDAVWHDGPNCTFQSKKKHILSDLISASYQLAETMNIDNVLIALKAAKYSTHKFQREWADEYTFDETSCYFFKFGFVFSSDKRHLSVRCRIRPSMDVRGILITSGDEPEAMRLPICRNFIYMMREIEKMYSTF